MGSNLVIVAIPDENDRVWRVSSEKVPHLTLLFLGESDGVKNVDKIVQFVEHAASETLKRFYLPIDRRDKLGEDDADVLLFKTKRYYGKEIKDFRATLLQDPNIKTAYDAADQFEGPWKPHLTLGYPETPAKNDDTDRDQGFYDVAFTKIAVWVGDYEGPEFVLKDWDDEEDLHGSIYDTPLAAWSDIAERGQAAVATLLGKEPEELEVVAMEEPAEEMAQSALDGRAFVESLLASEEELEHYGIRGMKWGVRKEAPSAVDPSGTSRVPHGDKRKTKIEVEGGQNHPAHEDAIKVAEAKAKLAKSGPSALSNTELREVANRVQLEQQVAVLTSRKGKQFVTRELQNEGKNLARQGVRTGLKKGAKRAVAVGALAI